MVSKCWDWILYHPASATSRHIGLQVYPGEPKQLRMRRRGTWGEQFWDCEQWIMEVFILFMGDAGIFDIP